MHKIDHGTYDAVIIGAGISGLVCGCYLAKAGMKVLVAEQHSKPGGYCTSFKRRGFAFDAAAHSFGGYKNGPLGMIFRELGIDRKIKIRQFDPSDIITTPDFKIAFWADIEKTIKELQAAFPEELNNIRHFFDFLNKPDPMVFARMRNWTFQDLLDKYFSDYKLKATLSFPLFGNGGLPPSLMSAFIGAKIYKEFLLDGGYYPEGGMQTLPDALGERLREFGGELRLSSFVKKIKIVDNIAKGVIIEKDGFVPSKYVISNCDARQTFLKLLGRSVIGRNFLTRLNNMKPTLSTFIVYLGVDESVKNMPGKYNLWFLSNYDLDALYYSARKGDFRDMRRYLIHASPEKRVIIGYLNVPYKSTRFWKNKKDVFLETFIEIIEKNTVPDLSKHIVYKEAATPSTLFKYTFNYKGAAYGWESIPSQLADHEMKKPPFIKNLYLTGHWTTHGLGIPGVTYLGYDVSKTIIHVKNTTANSVG